MRIYLILSLIFFYYSHTFATSMVYNFRIAQTTRPSLLSKTQEAKNNTIVSLLFNQYHRRFDGIRQNFTGCLESYIYNYDRFYFRADAALAHVYESIHHKKIASGTQTDDILLTFGYNFFQHTNIALSCSGILGIPTHSISNAQSAAFGISQLGTGVQLDAVYIVNPTTAFVAGGRYVYLTPRTLKDATGNKFNFSFGNIADLLFACRHKWSNHGMEAGYTFHSLFEPEIDPDPFHITSRLKYNGSAFYGVYMYKFFINKIPNRLLCTLSYAFQHNPQEFGIKYIITLWFAWSISF